MISYLKQLNNIGAENKINDDDLVRCRNQFTGKNSSSKGSKTNLANNKIKDIMTVMKSLENGVILLKGTTTEITGQEEGIFNGSWFNINETCTYTTS